MGLELVVEGEYPQFTSTRSDEVKSRDMLIDEILTLEKEDATNQHNTIVTELKKEEEIYKNQTERSFKHTKIRQVRTQLVYERLNKILEEKEEFDIDEVGQANKDGLHLSDQFKKYKDAKITTEFFLEKYSGTVEERIRATNNLVENYKELLIHEKLNRKEKRELTGEISRFKTINIS